MRVLDLSRGGGLIESGARLLPGANVDLQLASVDARATIRARVVRCCVGSVSPVRIVFRGALQFDAPLPVALGCLTSHQTRESRREPPQP